MTDIINTIKAKVQARISSLDAQLAKLQADYNAIMGAKQECEFWIKEVMSGVETVESVVNSVESVIK